MINEMAEVLKFLQTEQNMLVYFWTIKLTAKVFILGKMEKFMRENGFKELNRALEYGKVKMVTVTVVNGKTVKLKVMVSILGLMVTVMKVNGSIHLNMVREVIFSQLGILTKVNMNMASPPVKGNINGEMVHLTLVFSSMARNKGKVNGKKIKTQTVINMKETFLQI
jgi:hypothetical protein